MSVTRCVGDAMREAGDCPLTAESFKAIIAKQPEQCPHTDCSAGGCRAHVREALTGVWARRKYKLGQRVKQSRLRPGEGWKGNKE